MKTLSIHIDIGDLNKQELDYAFDCVKYTLQNRLREPFTQPIPHCNVIYDNNDYPGIEYEIWESSE